MSSLPSRVLIGTDHAGFALKQALVPLLEARGIAVEDLSPTLDPADDYPASAKQVAKGVAASQGAAWGIALCGSGIGASIAANRVNGVRAALIHTPEDARSAREHNHANVLVLGGRVTSPDALVAILNAWLETMPSQDARHLRRIAQLDHLAS